MMIAPWQPEVAIDEYVVRPPRSLGIPRNGRMMDNYTIRVQIADRDNDLWIVNHMGRYLNRRGGMSEAMGGATWRHLYGTSKADQQWRERHFFPLEEALALATKFLPKVKWNMRTAEEAAAWIASKPE